MQIWFVAYVDLSGKNPGGMVQILTQPMSRSDAWDLCRGMRHDSDRDDWGDAECYRVIPTLNFSKPWKRFWFGC